MRDEDLLADGACAFCGTEHDYPLPLFLLDCRCGQEHQTCEACRELWGNPMSIAVPETDLHSCPDDDGVRAASAVMG